MIVADTSALVSLATAGVECHLLEAFDVHTTAAAVQELEDTAEYDDHGDAADAVLNDRDLLTVHDVDGLEIESTRIDHGEASCVALTQEHDADFLLTDDYRALPELQPLADARVATSPILLKALVERGVLGRSDALDRLDEMAEHRSWLGTPIYRRARQLFHGE